MTETPQLIPGRPSAPAALHPGESNPVAPPRIFKLMIRSTYTGKTAYVFAKIPYGGVYACTETLTRALMTGEILSFRISAATVAEIKTHRSSLMRWPEALRSMTERTKVTWLA